MMTREEVYQQCIRYLFNSTGSRLLNPCLGEFSHGPRGDFGREMRGNSGGRRRSGAEERRHARRKGHARSFNHLQPLTCHSIQVNTPQAGRELYLLHVRSKTSIRGFQEIRYRVQENIGPETFEQGLAFFAANKGWTVLPVLLPSNGSTYQVEVSLPAFQAAEHRPHVSASRQHHLTILILRFMNHFLQAATYPCRGPGRHRRHVALQSNFNSTYYPRTPQAGLYGSQPLINDLII